MTSSRRAWRWCRRIAACSPSLSVRENLLLGAYPRRARGHETENLARVFALFPRLAERTSQLARTMSGGEQQMLAVGRALMSQPQILLLDEPSLGLSPLMCKELFATLDRVRELGVGVLLVEQNATLSLGVGSRGYLLANGRIVGAGAAGDLQSDPAVRRAYLGGGAGSANGHATPNGAAPQTARLGNSGLHHARENGAQMPARQPMPALCRHGGADNNQQPTKSRERIGVSSRPAHQQCRRQGDGGRHVRPPQSADGRGRLARRRRHAAGCDPRRRRRRRRVPGLERGRAGVRAAPCSTRQPICSPPRPAPSAR